MRVFRRLTPLIAMAAMAVFGLAVYMSLGYTRSAVVRHAPPAPLPSAKPAFTLPGTLFLAQGGGLYQMHGAAFTQIAPPAGWMQPVLSPDGGHLVAVRRSGNVSDLYQLGLDGSIQKQLTRNGASIVEVNHWAFYPRFTSDGSQLFFSTDRPKVYDYRVDLAVWEMAAGGGGSSRQWTEPNYYTGGDVEAVPLASGAILYTKYDIDKSGQSVSQIFLAARPHDHGTALTQALSHCQQPTVSPDGSELAMICATGARIAQLVVAPFDGHQLGPLRVLVDGTLAAGPAWAPDGSGLAYLAPGAADPGGNFQLWWAPLAGAARQLTTGADLDALSTPAWLKA